MYKRLRELRENQGISCREMGVLLGCSKSSYNKKERGAVPFTLKEAQKIAVFLRETVDNIFKITD